MNLFEVYHQYPINLVKGKGCQLMDDHGKQYLDFYGGHGVISIGHSHPYQVKAVKNQLDKISFYSNATQNSLQRSLAEKLCKISGYTNYKLFLCNSGAEANENALKIASFHTHKNKTIAFKGSFHGRTGGALAVTDNPSLASAFNTKHNVVFIYLNDSKTLEKHLQNNDVAAVILEGIQGVNGVFEPTTEFLIEMRELCSKHGAMLILDEVQSGYGRSGQFFAHQHANIQADIITMAKGMGNGFPVAGVLINPKIDAKKGMLGTTYGGNHLACAAAIAVLEVIEKENLIEKAKLLGDFLIYELSNFNQVKQIRGKGLMLGIDIENMTDIRKHLLNEYGIFTGSSGSKTLRLLPPLTTTISEAQYLIKALKETIN